MRFSTHRVVQLSDLQDRAAANRVRYYCNAIKAESIGNQGAAIHFSKLARKWESVRARAMRLELLKA